MRLLFLTKQQYMGKNLLEDRFGRFYEIPKALAETGHRVHTVCLQYWPTLSGPSTLRQRDGVEWNSFSLGWNWPLGFMIHYQRLKDIAARYRPDVIVGASDAAHVALASRLAIRLKIPYAVDLYDNFESYQATKIPGMKASLRCAVRNASAVSVVSDTLCAKVREDYRPKGILRTITNAIAPDIFFPCGKIAARRRLGLPEGRILIGTAGSLTRARGIDTLFRAFDAISTGKEDVMLVLAGSMDRCFAARTRNRVIYLGQLAHEQVGDLFNALDVGVICNRDDEFGRYCFPQKLFEMWACNLPTVIAEVGAMRCLPIDSSSGFFDPESADSLAAAIMARLGNRRLPQLSIPTWKDCGRQFSDMLESIVEAGVCPTSQSRPSNFAPKRGEDRRMETESSLEKSEFELR